MKTIRSRFASVVVVAAASAVTLVAQTPQLRPGQYETLSETSIHGRASKTPPQKSVQCFSSQDVKDFVSKTSDGQSCQVSDSKVTGPTMTFTKSCARGGNTYVTEVTITFTSPESYHGVATMKGTPGGPYSSVMDGLTVTTTAKRIGECAK